MTCDQNMLPDTRRQVEAAYRLAYELMGQQKHKKAAILLRLMLQLAPTDERAWLALGSCHQQIGQSTAAQKLFAAGVAAARSAKCSVALARIAQEFDEDAALEHYETAVEQAEQAGDYDLARAIRSEMQVAS